MTIAFPKHAWPLLKKALQHIADHPSEFDMSDWLIVDAHCGTTACLAGRITLIDNPDFTGKPDDEAACGAMGIDPWSPEGRALDNTFYQTEIETYEELCENLLADFTFPEPLPQPRGVKA
ncbi:hypothetical protein [Kineosporia babensis]|uniref:Uncharacterized protein n=1 Tax=Kineosporia babensis TaxID=499548 RepID=A0A9X1NB84_9ACTN|nr:hypothetical protein [Kineosporia babensis]MCD5310928.1 hypothetical protein [Kineosporia babensis]